MADERGGALTRPLPPPFRDVSLPFLPAPLMLSELVLTVCGARADSAWCAPTPTPTVSSPEPARPCGEDQGQVQAARWRGSSRLILLMMGLSDGATLHLVSTPAAAAAEPSNSHPLLLQKTALRGRGRSSRSLYPANHPLSAAPPASGFCLELLQ